MILELQQAAYDAQLAAGLPQSEAGAVILGSGGEVGISECASYLHAAQRAAWFTAAFPGHADPIAVVGGRGASRADSTLRWVSIGAADRSDPRTCEHACLHELAHVVTADLGPDRKPREPLNGLGSTRGHHHAWRANFVFIVRVMLGPDAANRLRGEFDHWGLPTA